MQIVDILDSYNIRYKVGGKNVSRGWVGLSCPFCKDKSNHLGIHLSSGAFKCWRCGKKGFISYLLQKLLDIPKSQSEEILKEISFVFVSKEEEHKPTEDIRDFLDSFISPLPEEYRDYLEGRNFDPDLIQRKYGVLAGGDFGKFKFKIISPIVINGKTVSFTSRDITARSQRRHDICPDTHSLMPRRSVLYNLDSVTDTMCIVEGVFDTWRIGSGAVATLSTSFSEAQVNLILTKPLKRVFIIYDPEPEAQEKGEDLGARLATKIPHVERIELSGSDPADLSDDEARYLRKELF